MLPYVSKESSAFIVKGQEVQEQTWTTLPLEMVLHLFRTLWTLTQQYSITSQKTRILNTAVETSNLAWFLIYLTAPFNCFSLMWHRVVRWVVLNMRKECCAFLFRVKWSEKILTGPLGPWRWRRYSHWNVRSHSPQWHSVTSHNTWIFSSATVWTSNLMKWKYVVVDYL
jgi:hypothetical protein